VLESAVVGRPDAERGSVVCAFVVLRDGVPADAAAAAKAKEIQDHVKRVVAPYKYPRDVRFTAALPRNASGKVQHFALREILAKEQAAAEEKESRP
jgi:2-aminobenzoate-CoA ligase